ncbi:hypothetical protein P3S68_005809 [Capsicum galapagoense]
MGRRRTTRKDQTPKNASVEGPHFQESEQQEAMASASLRSGRVRMKQEPKLAAASALPSAPPGFAPSNTSPSHRRNQTRKSLRAMLGRCESITVTPRSPIRHVKSSYPSRATGDFPAHLTTGTSVATEEKVEDSVHTEKNHHSVLTNHGVLGVENQKSAEHTQTTPSFPKLVSKANATEPEIKCDKSGELPTKRKVVDSSHSGLKHQSVLTNRAVVGTQTVPSIPEVVAEKYATLKKADVVSNSNATEPEIGSDQSDALPTKSMSLNLTKIAALMTDYSSDADEVESRPGHLSVAVGRYRVKEEAAPVLQKIFFKYGDIAMNCSFSSMIFSSSLLEFVCDICKKLEETDFLSITLKEIRSMLAEVRDLESAKIDVGWLSRRLNEISQAKQLLWDSCKLKEAKARNLVVMETNKKDLEELKGELAACIASCRVLQERIRMKEDEFGIARSENEKIMLNFADLKAKVNSFLKKSLLHDLI